MKIKITTDCTSDLSDELQKRYDITLIPLYILKEDKTYLDGIDIKPQDIFDSVESTGQVCRTAAANVSDYITFFSQFMQDYDALIHLNISDEFSCCHQNAVLASKEFENIYVFNSKNLSTGIGHLAIDAARLSQEGLSPEEILIQLEQNIPKVEASFIIDTLKYLALGGRCSSLSAMGANMLKIKPCIEVKDGKMGVGKKYRGNYRKVIENYVADRLQDRDDIKTDKVFVTHAPCDDGIVDIAIDAVKKYGDFDEILITDAGCSVCNHCGPNTLGVLFETK